MSMHANRAPFLEMTLLSMSLMSSKDAVFGPCSARIANQVTPDCDPCVIFIIFSFAYFTHHICVDNLFSFLVWDVGICYEVESVGTCNPFATRFIPCAYPLA